MRLPGVSLTIRRCIRQCLVGGASFERKMDPDGEWGEFDEAADSLAPLRNICPTEGQRDSEKRVDVYLAEDDRRGLFSEHSRIEHLTRPRSLDAFHMANATRPAGMPPVRFIPRTFNVSVTRPSRSWHPPDRSPCREIGSSRDWQDRLESLRPCSPNRQCSAHDASDRPARTDHRNSHRPAPLRHSGFPVRRPRP
jgi:hypothetical protein